MPQIQYHLLALILLIPTYILLYHYHQLINSGLVTLIMRKLKLYLSMMPSPGVTQSGKYKRCQYQPAEPVVFFIRHAKLQMIHNNPHTITPEIAAPATRKP